MPGLPGSPPDPEVDPGGRLALVVSTTTYADPAIRRLRAPAHDASDLSELLADPSVGGFVVSSVLDATAHEVRLAIEEFLSERQPHDLLLVYFSCHGLVDARRRLYFAATDTLKNRLGATGVEAQWLLDQLDDCRAKQQVVILDCCFSGAFARGAKGDVDVGLGERFHGQGRGRVVLTASRASEYSFEGEPMPGSAMPGSVFTRALVAGIRSGAADSDNDGWISVDDAYNYAFDQVRATKAAQTPQRWWYGAEGTILLARNPAGVMVTPAQLSDDLRAGLQSPHPAIRIGAVSALGEWLSDSDPARSLAARNALREIAENDVARVATAARSLLEGATDGPPAPDQPRPFTAPRVDAEARGKRAPRPGSTPWRERRVVWTAGALAVALAIIVASALERGGDAPGKAYISGERTVTATGPWRFKVSGNRVGAGCAVTLRSEAGVQIVDADGIYGIFSRQVKDAGAFRWTVNDANCEVRPEPGTGDLGAPPFAINWTGSGGDTDSFPVTGPIEASVTNYHGNETCTLELYDAATGQDKYTRTIDAGTTTPTTLETLNASRVYFHDLVCSLEIRSR